MWHTTPTDYKTQIGVTGDRIHAKDTITCQVCGHARQLSVAWICALLKARFPERYIGGIYQSDLVRFKCSLCGEKEAAWEKYLSPYSDYDYDLPDAELEDASGTEKYFYGYTSYAQWAKDEEEANAYEYEQREFLDNF